MRHFILEAGAVSVLAASAGAASLAPTVQAQFNNARPARPNVTLPEGPVRSVILKSCTACHGIDEYGYYAMDRESWAGLVDRMKVTPSGTVKGAVISDADREILLDWLVAEFGPESTPFPREYVPRGLSEDDYLSDGEAESHLEANCVDCHTLERVDAVRLGDEQWRARLLTEIGRGSTLLLEDVEPLVEWLARTRGINPARRRLARIHIRPSRR